MQGLAIYLEQEPDAVHPRAIAGARNEEDFYFTDSRFLTWTNQSVLTRRHWFLDTIMPFVRSHPTRRGSNGFLCPEPSLNCKWWRKQRFRIGVGKGLFTHNRVDGSWRPTHRSFGRSLPIVQQA